MQDGRVGVSVSWVPRSLAGVCVFGLLMSKIISG
jgi:hypothetical protein